MTSKRTKLKNVSFWKKIKMAIIETKNLYKTFDIKGNTVNALIFWKDLLKAVLSLIKRIWEPLVIKTYEKREVILE